MKQTIFTLLLLSTIALVSCRKTGTEQTITQYDNSQIQNYIKNNAITGMIQDTVGGDTSGIYYQPLMKGTGTPLAYTDEVSFVFTIKSLDGLYSNTDTINNHFNGYVGHIYGGEIPIGMEIAIVNDLKYSGASMRVLIPSALAFGKNGYGSGSINVAGSHIAGNQSLDCYIHVIAKQTDNVYGVNTLGNPYVYNKAQYAYDDEVIQNYIKTTGITFTKAPSVNIPGTFYYYAIRVNNAGTDSINQNSTITTTYEGRLLNNTIFDQSANAIADTVSFNIPDLTLGVQEALTHAVSGETISMLLPSALGYATTTTTGIPINSCLRFEFEIRRVSP